MRTPPGSGTILLENGKETLMTKVFFFSSVEFWCFKVCSVWLIFLILTCWCRYPNKWRLQVLCYFSWVPWIQQQGSDTCFPILRQAWAKAWLWWWLPEVAQWWSWPEEIWWWYPVQVSSISNCNPTGFFLLLLLLLLLLCMSKLTDLAFYGLLQYHVWTRYLWTQHQESSCHS
jgi:hypothetical protein